MTSVTPKYFDPARPSSWNKHLYKFSCEINTVYFGCCAQNCPNAYYLMVFMQVQNICTWMSFIL